MEMYSIRNISTLCGPSPPFLYLEYSTHRVHFCQWIQIGQRSLFKSPYISALWPAGQPL